MEDQYGMADLRQYMTGRPLFPPIPPPSPDLLSGHRSLTPAQHYHEMVLVGRQVSHDMVPPGGSGLHHEFRADSAAVTTTASLSGAVGFSGFEMETCSGLGTDGGTGRWPRQETLTLLEIRSRLDPKFKEANKKGPLWDEVSRIMSEEHGYQRSGKKCREKFENLYKYYKKTKEGKAGRQDGKHYRFFRQLEALYGESSNNAAASVSENNNHLVGSSYRYNSNTGGNNTSGVSNQEPFQLAPKPSDSLSLSNSSDFNSTSSEDSDLNVTMDNHSNDRRRKRKGRKSWKAKIKDFIDSQMRKIMEKQEAWLEKMMRAIEEKEQERVVREEVWRKQEVDRIDREHKFWANERAWIEARDATLMETLRKLTGKEIIKASPPWENQNDNNGNETMSSLLKSDSWSEIETTRLIQLRTSMEPRFQRIGSCPEQVLWEEIAAKMACLGYDRNALMCKDKWDSISNYLIKCTKKRKENSRLCCYLTNGSINSQGGGTYSSDTTDQGPETMRNAQNDHGASPPNSDTGNAIHDGSYRFLIGDSTENLWENYGMKFSKGENH